MTRCIVRHGELQVEIEAPANGSVETLFMQARVQFRTQFGVHLLEDARSWVVYSQRLGRDIALEDATDVVLVKEGDVLKLRSRGTGLRNRRRVVDSGESRKQLLPLRTKTPLRSTAKGNSAKTVEDDITAAVAAAPPGLPACRLGMVTVVPMKAEHLSSSVRFRLQRVSLAIRLLPYEETHTTATAPGPEFAWPTVSMRFKHTDPTRSGLVVVVVVYDEPPLSSRVVIGRAHISLEDALDAPGVAIARWVRVERAGDAATSHDESRSDGRLLVSMCFHPKVSKGPTVQRLLHKMAHAEDDSAVHSERGRLALEPKKVSFLRSLWNRTRRRNEIFNVDAASLLQAQSLRRVKGVLSLRLRGLHLCGAQCSKMDGHTTLSFPDFSPIVIVRFNDSEHEMRVSAADCEAVAFDHEWSVYSCFSKVGIEVYRRAALGAGAYLRKIKSDGCSAIQVGALSLSCFDIQERVAASWTLDAPCTILGPGKHPPQRGFVWYPVMQDDEEVGLAQIAAHYAEDLVAIVGPNECADLSYIPPDEREFDAAIIQRNFERLDDLYGVLKEIKGYWDDTLDWKRPLRTLMAWVGVNACFFCIPAAHFPFVLVVFLLALLSATFVSFVRGNTHKKWIEHNPTVSKLTMFRPIATLRAAPLRASHLFSLDAAQDHPDSFVRLFYEPNYKKIPVQQIAQTERAVRTRNPEWTSSQRDSSRDDFLRTNNNRLKELFRHLQSCVQDAAVHDVVEPWPRPDGGIDVNAFRLSMLQPVEVNTSTGEEILVDWHRSPGAIRFDVFQDGIVHQSALLGRVRIPIRSLVSDEASGGPQKEVEITVPLVLPARHASLSGRPDSPHHHAQPAKANLTVRLQLILRDPRQRISLHETLASEALYEAMELEAERELSWVAKYHKAKDVAKNIQQTLGSICSTLEKLKNLFLWVHPTKTLLVFGIALLGGVCFYWIPTKYFVLYATTKAITRKFHKSVDKNFIRFRNFLVTIPSDFDMKTIYHWRNQEFLKAKEHSEAQAKLQAQWSGFVLRQGHTWLHGWQERYCAVRGSRLEFWPSIADAKSGLPPKSAFCYSSCMGTCTKAEVSTLPKDCFPLVVFDVSRSLLAKSPRGRRRVICLKSEDDLRGFTDVVRASGEPMGGVETDPSPVS